MQENHASHDRCAGHSAANVDFDRNLSDGMPNPGPDRLQSHTGGQLHSRSLGEVAAELKRMRSVPDSSLLWSVAEQGACMETLPDGDPPGWLFDAGTDREVAARLCAGCPVQRECLELELRLYGADTVGVWGALGEDDRRALYPMWKRTREYGTEQ